MRQAEARAERAGEARAKRAAEAKLEAKAERKAEAKAEHKAFAKAKRKAEVKREAEPAPEPEAASSPPNVVGDLLPEAEEVLSQAGFKAAPYNTDTAFGIIIKSHYTICKQFEPVGNHVKILAQKYGCPG